MGRDSMRWWRWGMWGGWLSFEREERCGGICEIGGRGEVGDRVRWGED